MDVLVHCPDTVKLVRELKKDFPERLSEEDAENPRFLIEKTPTKRNGDETLSLIQADNATMEMLDSLKSVAVLGTYEEVMADKKLKAIHDRVYPRKPVKFKDEDGKERTHTPPERIGAFA